MNRVVLKVLFGSAVVATLCGASPAPTASAPPQWRQDLGPAFGATVCAGEVAGKPFAAWAAQAYDAQIEGHVVASRSGHAVALDQLGTRARSLAALRYMAGYSFGLCEGGQRGWIAVVPAPKPLVLGQEQVALPVLELERLCSSYRVDFAARDGGAAGGLRSVVINSGIVSVKGMGDGVLSLSCQPRTPRWQGPVLWYLAPVGQGPEMAPPDAESFAVSSAASALVPWLQRLRAKQGLVPLASSDQLSEAAANLVADASLVHNRQLLQKAAAAAKVNDILLLGEDRVRAHDVASMAWLLWNSPRHRQLLLNNDANAIGLASRAIDDDQLAVIVVGKGQALNTSVGTSVKAGESKIAK